MDGGKEELGFGNGGGKGRREGEKEAGRRKEECRRKRMRNEGIFREGRRVARGRRWRGNWQIRKGVKGKRQGKRRREKRDRNRKGKRGREKGKETDGGKKERKSIGERTGKRKGGDKERREEKVGGGKG